MKAKKLFSHALNLQPCKSERPPVPHTCKRCGAQWQIRDTHMYDTRENQQEETTLLTTIHSFNKYLSNPYNVSHTVG